MGTGASISAQRGRDFLLKVNTGTSPPTYNTVGGLRANDLSFNGNPVDISSKSSAGWRELMPGGGLRDMSVSGSGIFDSGNAAYAAMETAARTQALIEAEVVDQRGDTWSGYWAVATFKRSGPHDGVETFDVTLNSSAAITFTAGT